MRFLCTRLAALFVAVVGFVVCSPSAVRAEVGGFHVNLTPYAGYATFAPDVNLRDELIWGGRLGLGFGQVFALEGSYGTSSTETKTDLGYQPWRPPGFGLNEPSDGEFTHFAVDLQLNLVPSSSVHPYIFGGYSSHEIGIDSAGTETDNTYGGFNAGGGLKLHFSPRVALRLEARDMIFSFKDEDEALGASSDQQHNVAYTGGLQLTLGGEVTTVDTDLDGVSDNKDECPNTPAGCTVDANGCPVDDDRDGVCNGLDQCANTPAGCRVDANGCPMDSDADGVCDGLDQCPNTPAGARVDKDGCPIEVSQREVELLEKGSITARDIYFDTAKSTIKPESEKTLQDLCTIFQQWPTLQIEIGGHADSRGGDAYNMTLSEERAASVLEWFRTNCPNATLTNFTSKGYGETAPVASNKTAKGQAQNRRVEFKVMNPEELKRIKERRETLMKESGGTGSTP